MLGALVLKVLTPLGWELRRLTPPGPPRTNYVDAQQMAEAARLKRLSVHAYVDELWDEVGLVEANIARFASAGAFKQSHGHVVEIGPGTGRYLDHVLRRCKPARYDIYEVAYDWREWLKMNYPLLTVCEADGHSLSETEDANLVLSFGVFTYLPLMVSIRYFHEIFRVAQPNSYVIFDIFSETCLAGSLTRQWLTAKRDESAFLSKQYVEELFSAAGFSLLDSFLSKYGPGVSEFLVLKRAGGN